VALLLEAARTYLPAPDKGGWPRETGHGGEAVVRKNLRARWSGAAPHRSRV